MSEHTATPWEWDGDDLWHFGESYHSESDPHRYTGINIDDRLRESSILKANAEFIVRACNSHDALVEALEYLLSRSIPTTANWRDDKGIVDAHNALRLALDLRSYQADKRRLNMTDKEITEIIATQVMGWDTDKIDHETVYTTGPKMEDIIWPEDFSPLTDDSHCMMAWDKFSFDQPTELERLPISWGARVRRGDAEWIIDKDRRRAMCLCMVKAQGMT